MEALHNTLAMTGKPVEAEVVARKLIAAREPMARDNKGATSHLAWDYILLGCDLAEQRRPQEAEVAFATGLDRLEKLRLEHPREIPIRLAEIQAHSNSAIALARAARLDLAEVGFLKMVAGAERARGDLPESTDVGRALVQARDGLVHMLEEGRPDEALAVHRRRIELNRLLAARFPGDQRLRADLVEAVAHTYGIYASLGRPRDAEPDLERAIEDATRLVEAEPAIFERTQPLIAVLMASADLFEGTGRPRQSIGQLDRVAATYAPWLKYQGRPDGVVPRLAVIEVHRRVAEQLSKLGDHAGAARRLALRLELLDPKDRPGVQLEIARELLAAGDHPGARAAAAQAATDPATATEATKLLDSLPAKAED